MTTNESTITVREFAADAGISMEARFQGGRVDGEGWKYHAWHCILRRERVAPLAITFRMGLGLNRQAPELAAVLDSLASESAGVENAQDFEDWASEYGYDADSRSAERIYRECRKQADKLRGFLGEEGYERLLWNTERE